MKSPFLLSVFFAGMLMAIMSAMPVRALDDIATTQSFYDGTVNQAAQATLTAGQTALTAAMVAQADTNVTTVTTQYTPRRVGDLLVGGKGANTNAVWISKTISTNGWVQVAP